MNKLSKIFLVIIIVLLIAFSCLSFKYINAKKILKDDLNSILENAQELQKAKIRIHELEQELEEKSKNN